MSGAAGDGGQAVALQVSVAPGDLRHARHTLPHQLRQWAGQVDEVVFTLDRGPADAAGGELVALLRELCAAHPHARIVEVDASAGGRDAVGRALLGGARAPLHDCYGKVVHAYLFGLLAPSSRYVLHADADMLFGGGAQTWVAQARALLARRGDVFSVAPLGGPPADRARHGAPLHDPAVAGPARRFAQVSTRDFLLDRAMFTDGRVALRADPAGLRQRAAGVVRARGRRPRSSCPPAEDLLTRAMTAAGRIRVDFLGAEPGMWSIHPTQRDERFYGALPELVARVEAGDVPDAQRGEFDLHESLLAAAARGGRG